MALAPGIRLGPYEVLAPLGAGGMGEVYRARDSKLGRDVALKILPDAFSTDPDRLARFQREAKTLASLNHPNIGGIHGLEEANPSTHSVSSGQAVRFLVLELVEGEDLAQRIARGAIPLDETLSIARQIADALEAAHEQGIIHRDLKPANVKVRDDGTVKVLDFGLAKPLAPPGVSPSASLSPTITTPAMTQAGVILGTAAYMAPEQAKGKPADKRSDLWAFGCVLYEMLTGARAFAGDDVSDTLAAVLRGEPDWRTLPSETPASIRRLLRRCLEKDRKRRLADAAGARLEIDDAVMSPALDAQIDATSPPPVASWRKAIPAVAAAIIVGLAAGYGAWTLKPAAPHVVTRFAVALGADERFSFPWRLVALSPDGKYLAYVANSRVNLRPLDRLESVPVRGTESSGGRGSPGTRNPSFSPDGRWIGFWQDGQIKKVGINGGAAVSIAPAGNATSITWEDDGTILFSEASNILRVPESGGKPEVIVADVNGLVQSPHLLPGTRTILFTLFPAGTASAEPEIVVRSLDTGQQQTVIRGGVDADYLPTGHLAYYAAGTLLAVPFDLRALKVSGAPVPVAENVANSSFPGRVVFAHVATSRSGTLAYVTGARSFGDTGSRTLVWVDRSGREEPLGAPEGPYVYPRISPEGRRVALTVRDQQREIWILDVGRKTLARLTSDPAEDRHNSWTPDGKRIAFASNRGGDSAIWWQAADGTGVPERLAGFPFSQVSNFLPNAISPDGSSLVATVNPVPGGSGLADLWLVPLIGDHRPTPLLQSSFAERNGEISPDGRWIAYESLETGRAEIYVRPFPDVTAGKLPVSTSGGSQPLWARSGRELFFVAASGALMSVRLDGGSPLTIGPPAKVLEGSFVWSLPTYGGRQYDISADGHRFLVMKQTRDETDVPTSITVVQDWFEELKRIVPAK